MNNTTKTMKTVAAILAFVAIAAAIAGAVLMSTDIKPVYHSDKEYDDFGGWTYTFWISYDSCPEVVILPIVGIVCAVVVAVFFLLARKKKQASIVSSVFSVPALAALSVSGVLLEGDYLKIGWIGWFMCLGSAGLLLIACVFSIIILVKDYTSASSGLCKMSLAQKIVWLLSLILTIIAVGLAAVGSIIMFGDTVGGASSATHVYRGSGIMPLFGAVLLVLAAVLLIFSRKEGKAVIGNWVALFVSQGLLSASFAFIHSFEAWLGYWLCVSAASTASVAFVLSLIYGILLLKKSGAGSKKESDRKYGKDDFYETFMRAATILKEAKGLLDIGAFTEEEFKTEKRLTLDHYGLFKNEKSADAPTEEKAAIEE